jgi:exopolysaccharide production protein ExoQ
MPPQLALFLTFGFVIFLFRWESQQASTGRRALWIPLLWVLITGSRFASQWLAVWGVLPGGDATMEEGSPLDALVFLVLIAAGVQVLRQREVSLARIFKDNKWICSFLIYCLLSILWSDFPFVAIKRWIKILGHPIMALVIVTDPNPMAALRSLMKKAAFVHVPFSILFIKYYPEHGRGFDRWTGEGFNRGVNLNKNELGYVCMLLGLFFFWNLLQARQTEDRKARRKELLLTGVFLFLIWWLLSMSDSATSLACVVVGALTMVVLGFRWPNKKYIGWYVITGVLVFGAAEMLLGVYASVVEMLGRDPSLTDRTKVWADVLALTDNPLLGAGFESFWLGERLDKLWAKWWWEPNQAHNGYIETYINLGLVGLFLLAGILISTFRKIRLDLLGNFEFGRLGLGFLFVILIYNYSEATFKGVHLVWTVFNIIAIDYSGFSRRLVQPVPGLTYWCDS